MINKSTQKVFNNSLIYTIGTLASKAIGFFLVPLYTNCMANSEYGVTTTIINFINTFSVVVTLSLSAALIRFYNDYDENERKVFIGSVTNIILINSFVIGLLLILLHPIFDSFMFPGIDFYPLLLLGFLSLAFEGVYLVFQYVLLAKQSGLRYAINSLIYLLINTGQTILYVAILDMGALGVILASCLTNLLMSVYGIISMYKQKMMVFAMNGAMLKKALKYSLPFLPHDLTTGLKVYSDKTVINNFLTYAISGLYTLAAQFSSLLGLVQNSINVAFRPWFIEQMNKGEEGKKEIKFMSCMIMSLYSFCSVGIAVFSKEVITVFSASSYNEAWMYIPVLVISQLITFIYYSHVQSLMYNIKYSRLVFACSLTGLCVNVLLSLCLVQWFNIFGILAAQVIANIVLSTITVVLSRKAEKVDFGLGKMILYVIVAVILSACGMVATFIFAKQFWLLLLVKVLLISLAFMIFIFKYRIEYIELFANVFIKKKLKK